MQNDKKDLNAILASLDPKLREKIDLPKQEKPADVQFAQQAAPEYVAEPLEQAAAEIVSEPVEETPKTKLDEALAALDPKLRSAVTGEDGTPDGMKKAEDKAASILSFDGAASSGKPKNSIAYLGIEIIALECAAFFLFFATFHSETLGGVSLIFMLLPAVFGILYRMFKYQIGFKDAVSKCKIHIGISCFFLVCVMLSV
ncbi:hypothetical protein [Ruminococcus sp.]|uniref:hypothetical protein n=1 Tax=Ruminococcus sp. TaxID=41978 RepID=UPI0025DA7254|nr:hypothetical protein [Ruminococcus sp.]MCR4639065.1 hypothetical protein [Ruminococcus sp.]